MDNRFPLIVVVMLVVGCGFDKDPQPSGRPTPDVPAFSSGEAVFQDGGPVDAGMAPDSGEHVTPDAGSDAGTPDAGSDAGTPDAGSDAGTQTPPPNCTQNQLRCAGQDVAQICQAGVWVDRFTCQDPQTCIDGQCAVPDVPPVCSPGQRSCLGLIAQSCNAAGQWTTNNVCPLACSAGVCVGVCSPGAIDCSNPQSPQTCNDSFQWESGGICIDPPDPVCTPGQTDCQGDVPRSCNAQGQWDAGSVCPFLCSAGSCTGVCNPGDTDCQGDTPRSCNGSGQWVSGSECPFTCSAGSCQGECNPGAKQCDGLNAQTCNGSYQWATDEACPFQCSAGSCTGECSPGATDCQGDTPRSCNGSYQWVSGSACQYQCSAGACVGECNPGETRCNGDKIETCGGDFLWGVAADCPGANNADGYCDAGACTWDCNLDFDDCDGEANNGCEVNLNDDGMNCGSCGHDCCGGACGDGTCEAHSFDALTTNFTVDTNNIYWTDLWTHELHETGRFGGDSVLVTAAYPPQGIATDGGNIYYSTYGTYMGAGTGAIKSLPVGGGAESTVDFGPHAQLLLTPDGGTLLGVSPGTYTIYWYSTTDSSEGSTQGWVGAGNVTAMVSNDDYVFTMRRPGTTIERSSVRGPFNSRTTFATVGNNTRNALTIDDTNLYFAIDNGIWSQPLVGGPAVQLVASTTLGSQLDTDGTHVYYTEALGNGYSDLKKVPVGGGASLTIASNTSVSVAATDALQIADECAYWVGSGDGKLHTVATTP